MTYGTLPTYEEFEAAFDDQCPRGTYNIMLGSSDAQACENFKLGDGRWTCRALYEACQEIVEASQVAPASDEQSEYYKALDVAMSLVSGVMITLGFEWV